MPTPASASPPVVRRAAAALAVLAALVGVAACGGAGGGGAVEEERGVTTMLDRAFKTPVGSADLSIDAQLELEGVEGFEGPIRLEASGPYVRRGDTLPRLDLDVAFGVQDAGQAIEAGFLSTGERAFLEFGGEFYEQPREDVRRANRELSRRRDARTPGSLRALGLNPRAWVLDPRYEGTEEVAGVRTDHLSGQLDVAAMLADLNGFVERSGAALGGRAAQAAALPEAEIERLAEVFEATRFDVYVGATDSRIRRMSTNLELVVPEAQRERFSGVERGSLRLSVELADVDGDQRVEAPASALPISDLATQLRGIGALGGAGGLALPGGDDPQPGDPKTPDEGGGEQREGGSSELDALRRYDECLDEAAPDDTAALTRCSSLLPPR